MRSALVVGIDYYDEHERLYGCASDASAVRAVLERDGNGEVNFDCKLLLGTGEAERVDRRELKDHVEELFASEVEIALFYFAGHGHLEATGGYLVATDSGRGDEGLSLGEVVALANDSPAKNKVIVLDSCHSGIAGTPTTGGQVATLSEGLTILTASTKDQYATEENNRGTFTSLFVDALSGGAANLTGDITPGSVYAHVDQSLGAWDQRPVFKTNVKQFVSLRKVPSPISIADLRRIADLFPSPGFEFSLDPTYEPETRGRETAMPGPVVEHTETFAVLQKYNRLNLLVPVGAPHMWHAAMESKSCKLTSLGEHYRRLASRGRI